MSANLVSVGTVLDIRDRYVATRVRAAESAIGRVHEVPEMPQKVAVVSDAAMWEGGKYRWDNETGKPVDIRLNPESDHLELTALLEIGHLLDHQAIGVAGEFASISHARLAGWRSAIDSTAAVQKLEDLRSAGAIPYRFADGAVRQVKVERIAGYLLEPAELFSRSYAQFITQESGSSVIGAQIERFRRPENPSSIVPYCWGREDFRNVAKALESLIIELGWKK